MCKRVFIVGLDWIAVKVKRAGDFVNAKLDVDVSQEKEKRERGPWIHVPSQSSAVAVVTQGSRNRKTNEANKKCGEYHALPSPG